MRSRGATTGRRSSPPTRVRPTSPAAAAGVLTRPTGAVLYDDGGELEATAVQFGQYPDGRSDAKGIEAESLVIDEYGSREFMFVGSERGAFVAVYRLDGGQPSALRAAPVDRPGAGRPLDRFRRAISSSPPTRATTRTAPSRSSKACPGAGIPRPISRGSSRAVSTNRGERSRASPSSLRQPDVLYAVPDNALPSSIYSIHVGDGFARIRDRMPVTRDGTPVLFDLEGIAVDTLDRASEEERGLLARLRGQRQQHAQHPHPGGRRRGDSARDLPAGGRRCARRASNAATASKA